MPSPVYYAKIIYKTSTSTHPQLQSCTPIRTYTCTCTCIHACPAQACTHAYTETVAHTHIHTHAYTHTALHIHTHAYTHSVTHTHIRMQAVLTTQGNKGSRMIVVVSMKVMQALMCWCASVWATATHTCSVCVCGSTVFFSEQCVSTHMQCVCRSSALSIFSLSLSLYFLSLSPSLSFSLSLSISLSLSLSPSLHTHIHAHLCADHDYMC